MKGNIFKDPFSVTPKEVAQLEKMGLRKLMDTEQLLVPKKMAFMITVSLESGQKPPDLSVLVSGVPFDGGDDDLEPDQDWIKLSIGTDPVTKKMLSNYCAILLAKYDLEKRDKLMDDLASFMSEQDVFSFVIQV